MSFVKGNFKKLIQNELHQCPGFFLKISQWEYHIPTSSMESHRLLVNAFDSHLLVQNLGQKMDALPSILSG